MAISTNGTIITRLAGSLYGEYLSNASYTELNTTTASTVAANMLSNDFAGKTDAQIATTVLTNLGLTTVAGLDNWVAAQLTAAGSTAAAKGAKLVSMLNDYAMMTADATYGASATSFNSKVAASLVLSQTEGTAGGSFATAGTAPASGGTFALSTGTDTADSVSASRGTANSTFKFTSGSETISGSIGTVGDNDILLDDTTTDADVLNVNGGTGTFTSTNIETINLTTATAATLQLDKVTGTNSVNITGTNTVAVDGFAADTFQPTFGINNIKRVVTLQPATLAGTTTESTAETLNVSVSGLSYGTSSSTRSGITIDGKSGAGSDADGVLEVLNLTSTGSAANDFALAFDANDSVATINIKGDQSVQIRAISADVSGATVDASANTGTVTLRVDRDGLTMAATNAANWTGVDNVVLVESTAGTDFGVVSALPDASKVTFGSTFNASVTSTNFNSLAVQGATFAALKNSVTVELDNVATIAAGVTLSKLDVQNVKALNLISNGHAASTSTTGANIIDDLTGDFTTITITGDSSLELDLNINSTETTSTSTARTVVVTAAGMTGDAFVNLSEVAASTLTSYNITGSANGDTISLTSASAVPNSLAGTLSGGAGNDSLTGGNGNDAINGGDGDDLITVSNGVDTVTLGDGNDTVDINFTLAAAIAQESTIENVATYTHSGTVKDQLTLVINGISFNYEATGSADVTAAGVTAAAVTALGNSVKLATGVTLSQVGSTAVLKATGKTDGSAFTMAASWLDKSDSSAIATLTVTAAVTGVTAKDVASTITDFAVGDIINTEGLTDLGAGGYYEGNLSTGLTATTEYGVIVLTAAAYASADAAEDAVAAALYSSISGTTQTDGGTTDVVILFLNSTLGKVQAFVDADVDGGDTIADSSVIFTFDNITTLTGLAAAVSADNFII